MTKTPAPKKSPKTEAPVEVSPVSEWKKPLKPMELPSGKFMKIRRVSFQAFMQAGIIPNSLMAIVQDGLEQGGSVDALEDKLSGLMDDSSQITDMFTLIDNVTIFCAVEPQVHAVPMKGGPDGRNIVDEASRDENLLYVDEVDQDDKVFIFNLSQGGTDDVAQFRLEQANSVATVPGLSVVGSQAK